MRYVVGIVLLLVLLISCAKEPPVCTAPYILNGGKCCLDANNDSACDTQALPGKLDCSLCPPQFVTQKEQVPVYKYVCQNKTIVDDPADCGASVASNARLFHPNAQQDPQYVARFDVDAACRGKFQSAELHLQYAKTPLNITIQVQDDPNGTFHDAESIPVAPDIYYYIGFCRDCQQLVGYALPPDRAYLVRAMLQYDDVRAYTREAIIDPTPEGKIGEKICS